MNPIFPWKRKNRSGTYLKYEEGTVVPVEPKKPYYPPFLNENEGEDVPVKDFREIIDGKVDERKGSGVPDPNEAESSGTQEKKQPTGVSHVLMRLFWIALLGCLLYYFVPIFQYFIFETPKWIEQARSVLNGALEGMEDPTDKVVNEVKDKITQHTQEMEKNITDFGKQAIKQPTPSDKPVGLSDDEWLKLLSESQNLKQELVKKLKTLTENHFEGSLSLSRYRLEVKEITTKAKRQKDTLTGYLNTYDTTVTGPTVKALLAEYDQLENWSVALGSVGEADIIPIYNKGVEEQNILTQAYTNAFCSLLSSFGRTYTIQDGVIVY